MLWLSRLFIVVLVFSLVSGRAYFVRGFVSRSTNPRLYWKLVAFYLLVTSMLFAKLAIPYFEHAFSDAGTRAAREIEKGVLRLKQARLTTTTLLLPMESTPEGCSEEYSFQITSEPSIVITCKAGGRVTKSHTTNSHLKLVLVPQVFQVEKKSREPVYIELQMQNDGAVITGVH
jgi:hypothetical protein